jgi:hypothetical protein
MPQDSSDLGCFILKDAKYSDYVVNEFHNFIRSQVETFPILTG